MFSRRPPRRACPERSGPRTRRPAGLQAPCSLVELLSFCSRFPPWALSPGSLICQGNSYISFKPQLRSHLLSSLPVLCSGASGFLPCTRVFPLLRHSPHARVDHLPVFLPGHSDLCPQRELGFCFIHLHILGA